jgi:hypothetical protein
MHAPQSTPPREHLFWWLLAGLAIIVLCIYLVQFWKPVWHWLAPYYRLATNKEQIKAIIEEAGPLAPLLFISIQALRPFRGRPPAFWAATSSVCPWA